MSAETSKALELQRTYMDLGRRAAVAGGAIVALVSMNSKAPVDTACLRGGATYLAVYWAARLGSHALGRAAAIEENAAASERDSG